MNELIGSLEHPLIEFGLAIARDHSWAFAQQVATASPEQAQLLVDEQAAATADTIRSIIKPSLVIGEVLALVGKHESRDVRAIINVLDRDELFDFEGHQLVT